MSSELSAYSAARKCIRAFDLLIKQLQDRGSPEQKESIPPTELQNQCDRLRMWAGSVGALKQGHASLDYRLSNTPPMHVAVLTLLDQLGVFITECTDIVQGKRLPWEKVDKTSLELEIEALADDEDESDRESLESVTELGQNLTEITAIVSDLFKLSFKIRNSSFRSSEQAISKPLLYRDLVVIDGDTKVDIFSLFSTLDHRHVEEFFREIQHATGGTGDLKNGYLAERWANSITKRRRCFAYWRRHAKKLAHEDTATQAYNPTARIPLSPLNGHTRTHHCDKRFQPRDQDSESVSHIANRGQHVHGAA
ncbi:hypothetical protein F4780DRAFT_533069 [Xylariomycetidae sp. FL0641]|nr:hypothetical protein F4780DRAFT_533069 [Xylariomycetidae sp. FL0641]